MTAQAVTPPACEAAHGTPWGPLHADSGLRQHGYAPSCFALDEGNVLTQGYARIGVGHGLRRLGV